MHLDDEGLLPASWRTCFFALKPRRLFLPSPGRALLFSLMKKVTKKIKAWRLPLLPVAIHPVRIQAASRPCHPFASWIRLFQYAPSVPWVSGGMDWLPAAAIRRLGRPRLRR